jgi:DNA polymerase
MFIGEGPGVEEDKRGLPFVGRSGELLNELLESNDIHRENVFITSAVKCHPPKNRKPTTQELKTCKKLWLDRQIKEIKPEYIIILGGVAMKTLLGEEKLKHRHGKIQKKDHQTYFITYHPAAGLRSQDLKHKLEQDFKKLKNITLKTS